MIGNRPVGAIEGVVISSVSHEGLVVTINGTRARLAIIEDDGQVIARDQVAHEAEPVAVNSYRQLMQQRPLASAQPSNPSDVNT